MLNLNNLEITSPKRTREAPMGWNAFFPYYAGYPTSFASNILRSASLNRGSRLLDPWNGSGTSTYIAARSGHDSVGIDLNPVMVVVARARLLNFSEADSLGPLTKEIIKKARSSSRLLLINEPLHFWFDECTASWIRAIERSINYLLVGDLARPQNGGYLQRISAVASTFYVALFAVCRTAAVGFRASNPTWFKRAKTDSERLSVSSDKLTSSFISMINEMQSSLLSFVNDRGERGSVTLHLGDSTNCHVDDETINLVLTSPPYCTRIDYTSVTRVELAILSPLIETSVLELGIQMLGSTRVPQSPIEPRDAWGSTCLKFLEQVERHPSKASSGYYKKTHLDYFDKIDRAIHSFSKALVAGGTAICVVQDSYYKEIHNDLAKILTQMAEHHSLRIRRREDFKLAATLASSHPTVTKYVRPRGATESVLCFEKL